MPPRAPRKTGFAHRPLALRRELLAVLGRVDRATAAELASFAYAGRVNRSRPPSCSTARIGATRRALRRLIDRGHVIVVGVHRGRRLFALSRRAEFPPLELGPLDG